MRRLALAALTLAAAGGVSVLLLGVGGTGPAPLPPAPPAAPAPAVRGEPPAAPAPFDPEAGARAVAAFRTAAGGVSSTVDEAVGRLEALAAATKALVARPAAGRVAALGELAALAAGTDDPAVWRPAFAAIDRIFSTELAPAERAAAFEAAGAVLVELAAKEQSREQAPMAARLLGEMSTPAATEALVALLDDAKRADAAVAGLYRVADPGSAPLLARAVGKHGDREALVRALAACGDAGVAELRGLLLRPGGPPAGLADEALAALADAKEVPAAATALAGLRERFRPGTALPISRRGWSYVPPVCPTPTPEDLRAVLARIRAGDLPGAETLATVTGVTEIPAGEAAPAVLEALVAALEVPRPAVAKAAPKLLGRMRSAEVVLAAIRRVARVFEEGGPGADFETAGSLLSGWWNSGLVPAGAFADALIAPLTAALARSGPVARARGAIRGLSALGRRDADQVLVAAAERGAVDPRSVLGALSGPDAVETLERLALGNGGEEMRTAALAALGRRGRPGLDRLATMLDAPWTRDEEGRPNLYGRRILASFVEEFETVRDLEIVDDRLVRGADLLKELPVDAWRARLMPDTAVMLRFLDSRPDSLLRPFLLGGLVEADAVLPPALREEWERLRKEGGGTDRRR